MGVYNFSLFFYHKFLRKNVEPILYRIKDSLFYHKNSSIQASAPLCNFLCKKDNPRPITFSYFLPSYNFLSTYSYNSCETYGRTFGFFLKKKKNKFLNSLFKNIVIYHFLNKKSQKNPKFIKKKNIFLNTIP
jgi:hypothetical protein